MAGNNRKNDLVDPVEGALEQKQTQEDSASLSLENLKVAAIPQEAARVSKPFDGYPVKTIGKGEEKRNITNIVLYNHVAKPVRQDDSAPRVGGKRNVTYHSRFLRDYIAGGNSNADVVFDHEIKTKDGIFYGATVPDPYLRCQLCFRYDQKTKRVMVDERYLLLDPDQVDRLKKCFEQVINPQLKIEKAADYISGISKDEAEIPEEVTG